MRDDQQGTVPATLDSDTGELQMQLWKPVTIATILVFSALHAAAQTEVPPLAPPLGRVDFPPYETRTLENGIKVYALEQSEQPVVSIQLTIAAGGIHDPRGKPGVATFTASLLDSGTDTRTAQDIAETIDTVGGTISARAAREATIISASVLADSTEVAFDLITDIVMNPTFSLDELERHRQQAMSSMATNLEDPDFVADTVFNLALYGNHPYGHPAGGTPNSIQQMTRDDIVAFHDAYFAPNISALVIAGAVDTSEAFDLAEEWFGAWAPRDPPAVDLSGPAPFETRRILVIDNPASVQTEIRIGGTMVSRNSPDYFPVLIASYVLGGPNGRFTASLRDERGLTYGAYDAFVPRKGRGSRYAQTETRTEKTIEAIDLLLDEFERLRNDPVPEDELEAVKAYTIGSFPLTIETPSDLANRLVNVFVYQLGEDYLDTYRDKLAAITSSDVLRVAREQIHTEDVLVVLLGRADEFLEELEARGPVEVIPLSELDLESPTLRAPSL